MGDKATYPKSLLALTGDQRRGLDYPFVADLPGGERLCATDGTAIVAVSTDLFTGEVSSAKPPVVRDMWESADAKATCGPVPWDDLVARARAAAIDARRVHRARIDAWWASTAACRAKLTECLEDGRKVRDDHHGVRSAEATQARRESAARVNAARADRGPRPKFDLVLVWVDPDAEVPLLDVAKVALVDRALRACGIRADAVRFAGPLDPVVVVAGEVVAGLIMPCRS